MDKLKKTRLSGLAASLVLAIFLLVNAFFLQAGSRGMYEGHFDRSGIGEKYAEFDIIAVNDGLLDYLEGGELEGGGFFNETELMHLEDVRDIFSDLRIMYAVLLAVLLPLLYFAAESRNELFRILKNMFFGVAAAVIVLAAAVPFFEPLFVWFHELAFANEHWLLDPSDSRLINMFPIGFFRYVAARIAATWFLFALSFFAAGYLARRFYTPSVQGEEPAEDGKA